MGRLSEYHFAGETYLPQRDQVRLSGQMAAVESIMSDYMWHTLNEVATRCSGSEAGVSARIRDLRKPKFGSRIVKKRCNSNGLWEYLLLPKQS
jgi:hypothetical protein